MADGDLENKDSKLLKTAGDGIFGGEYENRNGKGNTLVYDSKEEDSLTRDDQKTNAADDADTVDTAAAAATEEQYPIDRGWAWMIVIGCFGMHILAVGGIKSFGVLFVEFESKYKTSSKALAGVQAVAATLMLALGPVSNALASRYTCRVVVMCGGLLTCGGFVCSAFIPSFKWLFVTYGLMGGIGFSLSYAPCVVMVGHHFKKRRSLANGISVSGSGVGGFALPNLMRFLLDHYGLMGALIIIGGLMLNICVFACLFRPLSSYRRTSKKSSKTIPEDNIVKNPVMAESDASESKMFVQKIPEKISLLATKRRYFSQDGPNVPDGDSSIDRKKRLQKFFSVDNNHPPGSDSPVQHHRMRLISQTEFQSETSLYASSGDLVLASFQNIPEVESITSVEEPQNVCCSFFRLSTKTGKTKASVPLFNFSLLLNPLFLIYLFSVMFANCGYPNIFMMLPSYAEIEYKTDKKMAALLLSIIGLSDLAGRLFFGWFSDLKLIPRRYIFMTSMAISGILQIILPFVKKKEMLIFFCSSFGFFAGAYVALIAVVLVDVLGVEMLSSAFGWVTLSMSVGLAGGPPLVGALRDMTSSWGLSFIVIGILTVIGSIIVAHEPLVRIWVEKKLEKKKNNAENIKMTDL